MSIGRMGARTAVVAAGVLVSLALMAAPSWAEKGGNSVNAQRCESGGLLLNQQGETLKNEGECTKYAAHGGQPAGLNVVAGPVVGEQFTETCSGFGLEPNPPFSFGNFFCGVSYGGPGFVTEVGVAADGTLSFSIARACTDGSAKVSALYAEGVTAEGTFVKLEVPPPNCS